MEKRSETLRSTGTIYGDELALLVDAVQDYAIFLLSPEGMIRSWNQGAARIMGYDAEEILGQSFSVFYLEEDLTGRKPQRELEIAAAKGRVEDEGWRIRRDGQRFWANTVITALHDESGTLVGFAKVTRDLTERREAEERQRHQEELTRLLIASVREYAIFLLDPEGYIVSWNPGAQRIKGYTADEIIGKHFSTFYSEEDRNSRKPERELEIARADGSVEDEGWRIRKDGTRFWANVVITAVRDETGLLRGFAKVTRDITDRREVEQTRLQMYEQREALLLAEDQQRRAEASFQAAQESNRAKDEFLMMLSHELRTPMTAILGWARLLPDLGPEDPLFHEAIASIGRSAAIQARLIDDVLDISRIVAGKLHLAHEMIPVRELVGGVVDGVRTRATERSISITIDVEPETGAIIGDPTRLHQIFSNLVTNALKFTPDGGTIRIHASRTDSNVTVRVVDSGEGIEPELLDRVFEPFRQAESPRTRVHGGLGLGLAIVQRLVTAHGGSIKAESDGRGHGATFTVVLPVEAPLARLETPDATTAAKEPAPHRPLANLDVLLVEDEHDTRTFVTAALRMAGASVVACDSPASAITAFDSRRPDVVITDIGMPGMDGYELARVLREREPDGVLIVALSAFPASTASEDSSIFDAYLNKPIEPEDLVSNIARIISGQT